MMAQAPVDSPEIESTAMIRFLFVMVGAILVAWGAVWFFVSDDKAVEEERRLRAAYEARFNQLKPAAEKGDPGAQYGLAALYHRGLGVERDPRAAFRLYTRAAEKGHAEAQFALGRMYADGEGVKQNYYRAAEWYALAVKMGGRADAQFALGQLYFHGRGVAHDYGEAVLWYRKAARQGHAPAQYLMGEMYAEGWALNRSYVDAYMWYTLALAKADEVTAVDRRFDPRAARQKIVARMNRSQIELAEKRVRNWRPAPR